MGQIEFEPTFEELTGHEPFPWQTELFEKWFVRGKFPASCNLPTGLGKTSVIAIWLIALAQSVEKSAEEIKIPRRLVYVVNRRTVVDQATHEAEKWRKELLNPPTDTPLAELADKLRKLASIPTNSTDKPDPPLAISTLRGQFADNREWSADPARPAIIVGTVDMIGSRLLFSGYGCGFKTKPLHAGFLGQDALLIHDEAHLEPAFQTLLTKIKKEQQEGERSEIMPWPKLQVMELSATSRGNQTDEREAGKPKEPPFELTDTEKKPSEPIPDPPTEPIHHVWRRLKAKKSLCLHPIGSAKNDIAKKIASLAGDYKDKNSAVLIFVRTLEEIEIVKKELEKLKPPVVLLTGTMRGLERDDLVKNLIFKRFLKGADSGETVYLICTSAGEVGIDISADHMVCDLAPFDSMIQRFGRVNRFGDGNAQIDMVHPDPAAFDEKDKLSPARKKTLDLLEQLPLLPERVDEPGIIPRRDASPKALSDLLQRADLPCKLVEAFTPTPTILTATDILFDAWALTTIREKLPGRPSVEPYLHGVSEWDPPETHVAWREDVQPLAKALTSGLLDTEELEDIFDGYRVRPWETLRDSTSRKKAGTGVTEKLRSLAEKTRGDGEVAQSVGDMSAIVIDPEGKPTIKLIRDIAEMNLKDCTVVLPIEAGGLSSAGTLDPDSPGASDVADEIPKPSMKGTDDEKPQPLVRLRVLLRPDDDGHWVAKYVAVPTDLTLPTLSGISKKEDRSTLTKEVCRATGLCCEHEVVIAEDEESGQATCVLLYLLHPKSPGTSATDQQTLKEHTDAIQVAAKRIGKSLDLEESLKDVLILVARWHDLGKDRERWQKYAYNTDINKPLAKSPWYRHWRFLDGYRHEFGSLLDVLDSKRDFQAELEALEKRSPGMKDLVLHLIAAHHGYARPHFPSDNAYDPAPGRDARAREQAIEVPRRFARLQRRYGRWGLAYLESLLRAADWAASGNPSAFVEKQEEK